MNFYLIDFSQLGFIVSLLRFAVVLGVLIFVHELGHFLVAKWRGVYVKRFSLGFGPKLAGFKKGETEYWLSAVPLGGYVKMAGQEDLPSEEKEEKDEDAGIPPHRKFSHKATWEKLAIIAAGPAMNIAAAAVIFATLFTVGMPVPSYQATRRVGQVAPDSPADRAGMKAGDRILRINGRPSENWEDIFSRIVFSRGRPLRMEVKRNDKLLEFEIKATRAPGEPYRTIGIVPFIEAEILDLMPGMPAEEAGIRPGDIILRLDGESYSMPALIQEISRRPGEEIHLEVKRDGRVIPFKLIAGRAGAVPGLMIDRETVVHIDDPTPEEVAAARAGDRIVSIDGEELAPEEVEEFISSRPGRRLRLELERSRLRPDEEPTYILEVETVARGMLGIRMTPSSTVKRLALPAAAVRAGGETVRQSRMWWLSIVNLFSGDISTRELGGPIMIYMMTEDVAREGFADLIVFLAKISIILALVNLVPLPILDGGNMVIFAVEGIRGKPLPPRVMLVIQQIGLALILMLFLLVIYNDVFYRLLGR